MWVFQTSKNMGTAVLPAIVFLFCSISTGNLVRSEPYVLDVYDSLYNHLIVVNDSEIVYFKNMQTGGNISAIDTANPARQVIPYTRYLFAPTLFKRDPKRVLSVGLGAGAINRLFTKLYPSAFLLTVELDPMMVKAAAKHTNFRESEKNRVIIRDARVFLRRDDRKWDWIILDAFSKRNQIPPHLTTLEFYRLVSDRLANGGIMVSNLHFTTRLFDSHVATLREAFPQVLFFEVSQRAQMIAVSVNYSDPPLRSVLDDVDLDSLPDASAYDVNFQEIKASLIASDDPRINRPGQILIDDFAPVEFLDLQKWDDK